MEIGSKDKEFTRLIMENKGIIYKICNSYCADIKDRDDLAQEIIYNLWKSFGSFNANLKFSTWMYRIALNVAISFYRQEKKFKNHNEISEGLIVFEDTSENETESNLTLLQEFINELKEVLKTNYLHLGKPIKDGYKQQEKLQQLLNKLLKYYTN